MDAQTSVTTDLQVTPTPLNPIGPSGATSAPHTIICKEAQRAFTEQYGGSLQAIVLTGSLARDEATWVEQVNRRELLSDAEFLLIFHPTAALPAALHLDALRQNLEANLLQRGIACHVGLSAAHLTYLRNLRPAIFAYELRVCGQVVYGDAQTLSLIPAFSPADLPLEDAWRLLCNRMIEQLEVADQLLNRRDSLPRSVFYRTVKLYLDMATSFLVFAGAYEPSYRQRAEKLAQLAAEEISEDRLPFPLAKFAERVTACTEIKLNASRPSGPSAPAADSNFGFTFWEEAVEYARLLWRWELANLTGTKTPSPNGDLLSRWIQRQRLAQRLRGWLYVVRKQGWHRSWRNWPRWARHAWGASPRYRIYAAASELFFQLPLLLQAPGQGPQAVDWDEIGSRLPVRWAPPDCPGSVPWRGLAADVVRNYHEFLEDTKS